MTIYGDSAIWRQSLLSAYELVMEAVAQRIWPVFRARTAELAQAMPSTQVTHEDPITRELIMRLRADSVIRDSPLWINSQHELLPVDPDAPPEVQGYADLAILCTAGSDKLVLIIECKRLNVRRAGAGRESLASKYVLQGVLRFVTGQYSADLPLGGMIGYAMDDDIEFAYSSLREKLIENAAMLLSDPDPIIAIRPPSTFRTVHRRTPVAIELRHVLVATSPCL